MLGERPGEGFSSIAKSVAYGFPLMEETKFTVDTGAGYIIEVSSSTSMTFSFNSTFHFLRKWLEANCLFCSGLQWSVKATVELTDCEIYSFDDKP